MPVTVAYLGALNAQDRPGRFTQATEKPGVLKQKWFIQRQIRLVMSFLSPKDSVRLSIGTSRMRLGGVEARGGMRQTGTKKIGDRNEGYNNNFNLLRMLAATGVLVSHAYPISLGADAVEPLASLLKGKTLGGLCVMIFFVISGFFIARSFARMSSLGSFLRARALRLFPALVVVLAVTVLAAAVLTTANATVYWVAVPEYYLRNVTLFFLKYELPGVFETNPYGGAINGSL